MSPRDPSGAGPAEGFPALPPLDRAIVWGGLAAISALAWLALVRMPMSGRAMDAMDMRAIAAMAAMPMAHQWTVADAWLTFVMWAVMMVAMMVPSASPMIALYARMARGRASHATLDTWSFAGGYLGAWAIFSAAATAAQFALDHAAILTGALRVPPLAGAVLLAAAGIYQLTPLKNACLAHCRSPLGFFLTEWRDDTAGAFRMGLKHGSFCTGCCWMLMALLFVAGVMNLAWVAAISIFVLLEKVAPWGRAIAAAGGVAMLGCAVALARLG
jgi:predicted metal-binding membrane protein